MKIILYHAYFLPLLRPLPLSLYPPLPFRELLECTIAPVSSTPSPPLELWMAGTNSSVVSRVVAVVVGGGGGGGGGKVPGRGGGGGGGGIKPDG